jgi:drug/metabolite transporter (DMT)-like permease
MDIIPQPILLIISMAACLGGSLIRKIYSDKFTGSALAKNVYNAISTGIGAIALAVMAICFYGASSIASASLFTVLLAIAFGIVTALQSLMMLKAFEVGPFAYTTVITSLSMLIPTLSGALIFKTETIKPVQYAGIALMVVCLVLSVNMKKSAEEKKATV